MYSLEKLRDFPTPGYKTLRISITKFDPVQLRDQRCKEAGSSPIGNYNRYPNHVPPAGCTMLASKLFQSSKVKFQS